MTTEVIEKDVEIKRRIMEIVADRGVSRTKLAEQIGVSPPYLASVINSPDKSVSATLLKAFTTIDININWLLTGIGLMQRGIQYKAQAERAEAEVARLTKDMDRANVLVKNLAEKLMKEMDEETPNPQMAELFGQQTKVTT